MKANKFFLGLALVGAILTACNKEPETVTGPTGDAYVSVQISVASTAGTRAVTDGGFEAGTTAEQLITPANSIFLFYDAQGKWVTSGQLSTTNVSTENKVGDHVNIINDKSAAAYIVLSGPDDQLKKSTQVLTVVNYNDVNSLLQLDKDQALAVITDSKANNPAGAEGVGFLMTTSAYVDGSAIVNTTAITEENIQKTQDLAKQNPVKIYIERASAKAELDAPEETTLGGTQEGDKQIVVDGKISQVVINITGWTLNNVLESTHLVKQLDATWATTAPFEGWNWAENHRCYWAKGTNWGALTNQDGAKNTVYTYNQATNAIGTTPVYCYENTVAQALTDSTKPNVNTVLIAANFNLSGAEGTQDFFRYNGVYYTEANYKNLILKQIKDAGHKKGENDFTAADLVIKTDGSLAGIQFEIAGYTEVQNFVNALAYVTEVEGYKNGMCYYQIPVEHFEGHFGMVRNHWYKIDVTAVKRIGEAVYNPNVIIPDIPEKTEDYYLAAEIHVLSWHVVNQSVEL